MSRTLKTLAACALIALAAAAGLSWLAAHRPEPARRAPRELGPVPVTWRPLEPVAAEAWVEAYGTLAAARTARLAFELGGRLVEVRAPWRPGEAVAQGELLARLDTDLFLAERRSAEAALAQAGAAAEQARVDGEFAASALALALERLELARAEERRAVELAGSGDVSESRRDAVRRERVAAALAEDEGRRAVQQAEVARAAAEAGMERARAQLELARERVERAELRAPFDGRLDRRGPELGTHLQPGEPVAELLELSAVRLLVQVDEADARELSAGALAFVRLAGHDTREREGRIGAVGVVADPATRAVAVEVELENPAAVAGVDVDGSETTLLRAGEFAKARLLARRVAGALVVHEDELRWIEGRPCAFVAVERGGGGGSKHVVERRELALGARVVTPAGWIGHEVRAGLQAGDALVTAPLARLLGGEACSLGTRETREAAR